MKDLKPEIYVEHDDKYIREHTFKYFDEGISKFPNRLDIRFGKIYILGQLEDYENFSNEIVKTIQYSSQNNNQWLWSEDANYDGGEKEFLFSPRLGYRYEAPGGFLFRIGLSPVSTTITDTWGEPKRNLIPWGYLSFGYTF